MYYRREYLADELLEDKVLDDPYLQFMDWIEDALRSGIDDPTAMALATTSSSGKPSVRIVLLKDAGPDGLVFFSNYESRKGKELELISQAAAMFFWPGLERQIRIEGKVERVSTQESDEFFQSRPLESRIASIISPQSQEIPGRDFLINKFEQLRATVNDTTIKRPEYWGGYILKPDSYEFWQGRENRLNDRILYSLIDGDWMIKRLAP